MLLTQKHSLSVTSVDGDPNVENNSEEVIRRNAYVLQEIENVLKDYPEYPYQLAFSINELRSKLVAHVMSNLSNCYSTISVAQKSTIDAKFPYRSKSERMRLDVLIRGSILHLLRENADWISCHIQRLDNSVVTHWNRSDYNKYGLN